MQSASSVSWKSPTPLPLHNFIEPDPEFTIEDSETHILPDGDDTDAEDSRPPSATRPSPRNASQSPPLGVRGPHSLEVCGPSVRRLPWMVGPLTALEGASQPVGGPHSLDGSLTAGGARTALETSPLIPWIRDVFQACEGPLQAVRSPSMAVGAPSLVGDQRAPVQALRGPLPVGVQGVWRVWGSRLLEGPPPGCEGPLQAVMAPPWGVDQREPSSCGGPLPRRPRPGPALLFWWAVAAGVCGAAGGGVRGWSAGLRARGRRCGA
ncbi:unnamed protein product [Arctogadus glacialis]